MNIHQAMMQGARLEAQGRLGAAQAHYQAIVAAQPECHAAWHAQGLLALRAGRAPAAALWIGRASRLCPGNPEYHRSQGDVCRTMGQMDKAIASARAAVAINPIDAESLHSLGMALTASGLHGEATWAYRLATSVRPDMVDAWQRLGASLETQGESRDARAAYERAIHIDPHHAAAQNSLGLLLKQEGNFAQAAACFAVAIRARPGFLQAHANLAALKHYTPDDPHVAILEALGEVQDSLCADDQMHLQFALEKSRRDRRAHLQSASCSFH